MLSGLITVTSECSPSRNERFYLYRTQIQTFCRYLEFFDTYFMILRGKMEQVSVNKFDSAPILATSSVEVERSTVVSRDSNLWFTVPDL